MTTTKTQLADSASLAKTAIIDDSQGPVIVAEGAKIGDFVKLVGPCYVGKNCLVGDYSFVRESSLEAGAKIGANTEVVRSICLEGATLHFGYLADSIIGQQTTIGAGLITANKLLSRKNIQVQVKDSLVDSHRANLGVIVGEKAVLGIGVRTMPGILIGSESVVYPTTLVTKNTQAGEKINWTNNR